MIFLMDSATIIFRTAVMTVLSVSLGIGSHVLQGGEAPERSSILLSLLAVATITMPLMRRQLGVFPMFSLLMLAQWVVHLLASFCADCAVGAGTAANHHLGASDHLHGVSSGNSIGMILGHAFIVALAAWWMSRGEALFADAAAIMLAGLISLAPAAVGLVVTSKAATGPVRRFREPSALHNIFLSSSLVRRGPPAAA